MKFACGLDERICKRVARGNEEAFNIICEYHMDDVRKIRNYMLEILRDKYFYDVTKLEQVFEEAIVCLNIDVHDLIEPTFTVVSVEPEFLKIAGL